MNPDHFVPATQIRGWIRSLCDQNQPKLIQVRQSNRLDQLQREPNFHSEIIDQSETDSDRIRAARFYHGAFWRFACDAIAAQGVTTALLDVGNGVVAAPDWIFDPSSRLGENPAEHAPRRYFRCIDKEELKVIAPPDLIDPSLNGRGITESYRHDVQLYTEKARLVGAQWLWPKASLPTLETLASYVHLPTDYLPTRPVFGLQRNSDGEQIESRKVALMSHCIRIFCEKESLHKKPNGISMKALRSQFVIEYPHYETKNDDAIRQAFIRYWNRQKLNKSTNGRKL